MSEPVVIKPRIIPSLDTRRQQACSVPPSARDRERLCLALQPALEQRHGKKRFYRTQQVLDAMHDLSMPLDWGCWGLARFTSPRDFAVHHAATGETCDWAGMHQLMTDATSSDAWSLGNLVPDVSGVGDLLPDMPSVGDAVSSVSNALSGVGDAVSSVGDLFSWP
jgi:hypothetical protein